MLPERLKAKFPERLKAMREANHLTQEELADRADIPYGTVRNYEQGISRPSWENVVALADALGVSCEAFRQPNEPAESQA